MVTKFLTPDAQDENVSWELYDLMLVHITTYEIRRRKKKPEEAKIAAAYGLKRGCDRFMNTSRPRQRGLLSQMGQVMTQPVKEFKQGRTNGRTMTTNLKAPCNGDWLIEIK